MDPLLLLFPGALLQAALVMVVICYLNAGPQAAKTDLIGIRLESTMFSEQAWRTGHRAGIFYCWLLVGFALSSLIIGICLLQWEQMADFAVGAFYILATLVSSLVFMRYIILAAHKAARRVVLAEDGN